MLTAELNRIIRQRDPELKRVVERLAHGQVREAIGSLARSGRVQEICDPEARMNAIARDYAIQPHRIIVVSLDNRSRMALNERIHQELQATGTVSRRECRVKMLVPNLYLTGADRKWAGCYEPGHVVRYTHGSNVLKLKAGRAWR